MTILTVRHITRYRYAKPASFGEHRMMFRPRESYDQRLIETHVTISPKPAEVRYFHDVFGNTIGLVRFNTKAKELVFDSYNKLEHLPEATLDDPSSPDHNLNAFPFTYPQIDLPDLRSSIESQFDDPDGTMANWSRRFLQHTAKADAFNVLSAMTKAIHKELDYIHRASGAPQTPLETLKLGSGTCRDFAVLMIEGARMLGLAARFVSGYLYSPKHDNDQSRRRGGGNTHAWVRIYMPSGGWVEFDPTNGLVGNSDLIRVAIARDPGQALPLSGTWHGNPADYLGMDVRVDVSAEEPPQKSRRVVGLK
ncbi:MAG TPA: transglutaminase family protein [Rhizomicrobium sp.]|jgi:transglutaminase-like putative cysteine protease|nr:transglutaminase family protein [Rhizomicrobium sp.]